MNKSDMASLHKNNAVNMRIIKQLKTLTPEL